MESNFLDFSERAKRKLIISAGTAVLSILALVFFDSMLLTHSFIAFSFVLLGWSNLELMKAIKLFNDENYEREAILSSLSDGVLQFDSKRRVVLMNSRAEELLGLRVKDLEGLAIVPDLWEAKQSFRGLVEVIYPELAPFASQKGGDRYGGDKGQEIHTSYPELRLFVVSKQIKNNTGKTIGNVKIIRDITHDELISKIKSEFVSVAAHQLRTPLAGLKWSIKLMLDGETGPVNEKQKEFLEKGFESSERMVKLVNDLLNVARIEEGRFGYEFKEIDYVAFVEKLVKNYEPIAKKKKINMVFSQVKDLIPPLYADPERIQMALSNLIENALKYTLEGEFIKIIISLEGEYVKTIVSDTGVGIPALEQARIFSKFFRASNIIKLETEGTGLGLYIVKNIVERHGGHVTFVSEEKRGTTFTILLPIKRGLIPNRERPMAEEFLAGI
ncbi:PAS domain-containing protein [Candidatus Giovannonibacteria bacterium]|nr:PAS domain-containing protein [Candidatus Giovannonibacteria bacterium]